jgi:hypothetical protein
MFHLHGLPAAVVNRFQKKFKNLKPTKVNVDNKNYAIL